MRLALFVVIVTLSVPGRAQRSCLPPASVHIAFQPPSHTPPPTAWEEWLRKKPDTKKLLTRRLPDFGLTQPMITPSTPEDDPFEDQLTLIDQGQIEFGVSGGRGFNLRNIPRNWRQWAQLLHLRNLLHLREWVQPESNELRMQNLVGASFFFRF